jgi:hypothetical protein
MLTSLRRRAASAPRGGGRHEIVPRTRPEGDSVAEDEETVEQAQPAHGEPGIVGERLVSGQGVLAADFGQQSEPGSPVGDAALQSDDLVLAAGADTLDCYPDGRDVRISGAFVLTD